MKYLLSLVITLGINSVWAAEASFGKYSKELAALCKIEQVIRRSDKKFSFDLSPNKIKTDTPGLRLIFTDLMGGRFLDSINTPWGAQNVPPRLENQILSCMTMKLFNGMTSVYHIVSVDDISLPLAEKDQDEFVSLLKKEEDSQLEYNRMMGRL